MRDRGSPGQPGRVDRCCNPGPGRRMVHQRHARANYRRPAGQAGEERGGRREHLLRHAQRRWRRVHEARPILVSQGALTQDWGKNWKRIKADFIEQARQIGEELLP